MIPFRWRIMALLAALLLVETASFWKLWHWLTWTMDVWIAWTSAVAFIGLLLASIIAMGSEIPEGMRKEFYIAGVWLFSMQGLANVVVSYQYGLSALPVEIVADFFNIAPSLALKSTAFLQGATLSVVSIAWWSVLGHMLRRRSEELQQKRTNLRNLEELMQEVA